MEFSPSVTEALEYYVYCLVDPRDKKIFYIGKGQGNRVFAHSNDALNEDIASLKLDTIRSIRQSGFEVSHYIIRHRLSEDEAFMLESTLIDFLTYPQFNMEKVLTNLVSGHHQWDEGIKTVEDIQTLYECQPIEITGNDVILLVSLNRTFNQAKASGEYREMSIYDATRKSWAIGKSRPDTIKYVLGIYRGIVRSVIEVKSYKWIDYAEDGTPFTKPRCCFEGVLVDDSPYLNKDVSAYPFGTGAAIRFIVPEKH